MKIAVDIGAAGLRIIGNVMIPRPKYAAGAAADDVASVGKARRAGIDPIEEIATDLPGCRCLDHVLLVAQACRDAVGRSRSESADVAAAIKLAGNRTAGGERYGLWFTRSVAVLAAPDVGENAC